MEGRQLSGQHAIVTGGSRGIGAAIAAELARYGAQVTIMARDQATAAAAATAMEGDVRAVAADVTRVDAVTTAFEAAAESDPVSILVNNVGGAETAPFLRTSDAVWERMLTLNLTPVRLCTGQVLPGMLERGAGRIVNIASTAGVRGYSYVSAYVAAKHAVVGLTRALAAEVAGMGVTVNAVCPGFADTDMTRRSAEEVAARTGKSAEDVLASYAASNPHGRLVRPAEVAAEVVWFCQADQAEVNGLVVTVDGGEQDRRSS